MLKKMLFLPLAEGDYSVMAVARDIGIFINGALQLGKEIRNFSQREGGSGSISDCDYCEET